MENMRQVAGYARNAALLAKHGMPRDEWDRVVDCLIVYPVREGAALTMEGYAEGRVPIEEYHLLWKLGMPVPMRVGV